jgi:hypothetical protein
MLVSLGLDKHVEDLAFRINGPPKVDHPAVNSQIALAQMPSRMRPQAALSQGGRNHRSENQLEQLAVTRKQRAMPRRDSGSSARSDASSTSA